MTATIIQDYDSTYHSKFYLVTSDLKKYRINQLKRMKKNSVLVIDYLNSRMREGNLKPATRASTIDRLYRISIFHKNKPFIEVTTNDIFAYIDTLRKTDGEGE